MDSREAKRFDRLRDELAHLLRREEIVARLRTSEARKVERQHLEVACKSLPNGGERENALGPRAKKDDLLATLSARRVADLEPIDGSPCHVEWLPRLTASLAHCTAPALLAYDAFIKSRVPSPTISRRLGNCA